MPRNVVRGRSISTQAGLATRCRVGSGLRGDGIILRTTHKLDMAKLLGARLPVVELFPNPALNAPLVRPNGQEDDRPIAAEHFLDRGLAQAAFFCTDQCHLLVRPGQAFQRVLKSVAIIATPSNSVPGRHTAGNPAPSHDLKVIRWLHGLPKPCGVFYALHAMQLTRSCRTCGILLKILLCSAWTTTR